MNLFRLYSFNHRIEADILALCLKDLLSSAVRTQARSTSEWGFLL
jgi:hypothetical protein